MNNMTEVVEVLVEGGKASAGPPIGPALGPHGVNVVEVVNTINAETKEYKGMKVPVKIAIDPATKKFEITVGTPPASALILQKAGIEKGSSVAGGKVAGNITMQDVIGIVKIKKSDLLGKDAKAQVREIVGTCLSMGVTIDGKNARDIQKAIEEGTYDSSFQ
jgi:large subunit ribosomal protein L11